MPEGGASWPLSPYPDSWAAWETLLPVVQQSGCNRLAIHFHIYENFRDFHRMYKKGLAACPFLIVVQCFR